MKSEKCQWYKFHNELNIRFITDNPDFYSFVNENFSFFKTEPENSQPDLEIKVYFHKKNNSSLEKRLAYNLFSNDDRILYYGRGFKIYAHQKGKLLQINTYVWNELFRDSFNLLRIGRKAAQRGKYLRVMRNSFHLPLFYLLESRGYIILHGSAVAKNNKAYLFLGANYVGKTTIALNLIYSRNFKLLGDNFLIIKDNKLYAFPDQIGATSLTLNSLPVKIKSHLVSDKHRLNLPLEKIILSSYSAKVFFIQLGPEPEIKKIDINFALKRLNATHNYLQEFPEYSYLAFLPHCPSIGEIQTGFSNFLKNQEIFSFQSSPNIDKNMKLLLEKLD